MMKFALKTLVAATVTAASFSTFAEEATSPVTGSVGVYNKYIFRGGVEDDSTAIQLGLNYAFANGVNVGYWGSSLSYNPTGESSNGIETDLFVNYPIAVSDDLTVTPQVLVYYYHNGTDSVWDDGVNTSKRDTTAYEPSISLAYKGITLGAAVFANDHTFGNAGDVYLSAAYSYALPNDFTASVSAGGYILQDGGDSAGFVTSEDSVFSEARFGVSHPVGNTGADVSVTYLVGGKFRDGTDLKDQILLGLSYAF